MCELLRRKQTNVNAGHSRGISLELVWFRKGERSLDLKEGKKLGEEWGWSGRIRVPGKRNSMYKGPEVILSLKKLGLSKEMKTDKYSSKGLSSKSKQHSQPISQPT